MKYKVELLREREKWIMMFPDIQLLNIQKESNLLPNIEVSNDMHSVH